MKKIIALLSIVVFSAFQTGQPKVFKVQSDLNGWQRVLRVIDLSKAEPEERIAVRDFIINQLNDTTINKK